MGHVNIFKTKSKEELVKLYGEFLKVEETGFFDPETDLGGIREIYSCDFEQMRHGCCKQNYLMQLLICGTKKINEFRLSFCEKDGVTNGKSKRHRV